MLPPGSHILYIPAVLILGVVLGFIMGARAARDQGRLEAAKETQRRAAREERAARRAAKLANAEPAGVGASEQTPTSEHADTHGEARGQS